MLLLIDNYDSFTYNLYQYLAELGAEVVPVRNDKITLEEIEAMAPQGIVVSPGPCTPREAGISNDVIRHFGPRLPVLGVCLGHQCMGQVYGGTVDRAGEIRHGKTSTIHHTGQGVLAGLPDPFEGIRYHSLGGVPGGIARLLGNHRLDRQWPHHGFAPQRVPGGGSAISPGVHHDPGGQAPPPKFPGPSRVVDGLTGAAFPKPGPSPTFPLTGAASKTLSAAYGSMRVGRHQPPSSHRNGNPEPFL